jgi:hypothetical protein
MRRSVFSLLCAGVLALSAVGCGGVNVPPKLGVRDVGSGRSYTTYEPWGEVEKGVGYGFTDIDSGKRITLTNYELSTLEGKKTVPGDSAEAQAFKEAKARGGVK